MGDVDIVWGEVTDPIKHKGYGLAHIVDKHPDITPKTIATIVKRGSVTESNGIKTIKLR